MKNFKSKIIIALIGVGLLFGYKALKDYDNKWKPFAKYQDEEGGQYEVFHKGTNDYRIKMISPKYKRVMQFDATSAIRVSETEIKLNFNRDGQNCLMLIPFTTDTSKKAFIEVEKVLNFYLTTVQFPEGAKNIKYNEPDHYDAPL